MLKYCLSTLIVIFSISFLVSQNESTSLMYQMIQEKHLEQPDFQRVNLFSKITSRNNFSYLNSYISEDNAILNLDKGAVKALYNQKSRNINLYIPYTGVKAIELELTEQKINSGDIEFGTMNNGNPAPANGDQGRHFCGYVVGYEKSLASISIFADGSVMGIFATGEGNYVIGKLDGHEEYIVYNDKDLKATNPFQCQTEDLPRVTPKDEPTGLRVVPPRLCKKVRIYWEAAYNVYAFFSNNLTNTQNHLTALFNNMKTMYANEGIAVELSSLYIWTTQDIYNTGNTGAGLNNFMLFWNNRGNGYNGDIAHLVSRPTSISGGVAYVDVLCFRNYAYGHSQIFANNVPLPTYSWDVEVVTHETGHNLGSDHTQACSWIIGGSCKAIDNCASIEEGLCDSICPSDINYLNPPPGWKGTIMSYCHLTSIGIDFTLGFGPLPQAKIRSDISGSACLQSILAANLTPTPICTGNDGAVALSYPTTNYGIAPFTYNWSNGSTSQNISGLNTPNTYRVTVTDANSCTNSFSTTLISYPNPGNGQSAPVTLPVACDPGTPNFDISASAPANLTTCQTVAWLRTRGPVTTYTQARDSFLVADPSNIMYSSNSNVTTGALLTINPPNSCSQLTTYYYTPFTSKKTKSILNLTNTKSGITFSYGLGCDGQYVRFDNQSSLPSTCDLTVTPTASISVTMTISGSATGVNYYLYNTTTGLLLLTGAAPSTSGTFTIDISSLSTPLIQMDLDIADCAAASSISISATRTVNYPAITTPNFESACRVGTSVLVSFAPPEFLPVKLVNFYGKALDKSNELYWEIATAQNLSKIVIERSEDGISYGQIGEINSAINSNQKHNYSFNDPSPQEVEYYRLSFIDNDGKSEYSPIIILKRKVSSKIDIFPNPFHSAFNVDMTLDEGQTVRFMVIQPDGKVLIDKTREYGKGSARESIDLNNYASGIYFLKVIEENSSTSFFKIMKY